MYEVVCVGNAIVDLISPVSEELIKDNSFDRGGMTLVDASESKRRLSLVQGAQKAPGGSAANTAACLASLGTKVAFIGRVGRDELGDYFSSGMRELGVDFICHNAHEDIATANCLAMVTPDGERTMSTYLGACVHLGPGDIPADIIRGAGLVLIEGYLLYSEHSAAAVEYIYEIADKSGTPIAISLSDSKCVERHHEAFVRLTNHPACKFIISNEKEMRALRQLNSTTETIHSCTGAHKPTSVVTLGGKGAAVVYGNNIDVIEAEKVDRIVDLVGAGDAFAAGFLHGVINELSPADSILIGGKCAAVVISGQGARPHTPLKDVIRKASGTLAA